MKKNIFEETVAQPEKALRAVQFNEEIEQMFDKNERIASVR